MKWKGESASQEAREINLFNYKPKVLLRARYSLPFTILKTDVGLGGECWDSSVVLAFMLTSRESIKPLI